MPFAYRDRLPLCKYAGVYSIVNTRTGKVYVGSALVVRARLHCHRSELRRGVHANPLLQRAWDKYGEGSFRFDILEGLKDRPEVLIEREQFWIDRLGAAVRDTGYNINPTAGASPMLGRTHTPEAIEKMRSASVGRDMSVTTEAAVKATKGKRRDPDAVARGSAKIKGQKRTPEQIARIKANHWSKRADAAEIAARTVANRPQKLTPEHRANIAEGGRRRWFDKRKSDEQAAQPN